jgi:DNA-binding MarR family transcriptional regulator
LVLVAKGSYSNREIATSLGISHQILSRHLEEFSKAGISIHETF